MKPFPHLHQPDQMDCGATCLAMIAKHYGKTLDFSQEMSGSADIITEDLRLIERFFNPIKAVLKR